MSTVTTNILSQNIQYENILADFVIVQFTQSNGYIKYGAQFIDDFSQDALAKGVVFENGKSLYTLFLKTDFENIDLRSILDKGEGMDVLEFTVLSITELKGVPSHLIIQLLVNSLSTPKSERLRFNNLTGKLYLFNESLFEKRKFKEDQLITKIPAIEFKINSDLNVELRTTTFTSLLLKSKLNFKKKALGKYSKYTYVHSTKSMRRILQSEKNEAKDVFIIKQEPSKKSVIPFMDFSGLESYMASKMGQLSLVMTKIQDNLSKYLTLEFEKQKISRTEKLSNRTTNTISQIITSNNYQIHLMNSLGEEGQDYIDILKKQLTDTVPDIKISSSARYKNSALNLRLIHNETYYDNLNITDIRDPSLPSTQHITVEDFNFTNTSVLKATMKELLLKKDVQNNQISIIDWQQYGFSNNLTFGIKKEEEFYFLTISPSGKMAFEKKEPSLFNQSEFDDLISIFEGDKNINGIIKNDLGQINIITRTSLFTLPEYLTIYNKLLGESKVESFLVKEVIDWLSEIEIKTEHYTEIKQKLIEWTSDKIKKDELLVLVNHRTVRKKLARHIYDKTGIIVKVYMRDQSKYELMDSNLDVHSYLKDGKLYFYVGTIGEGMRNKIGRASVIREISGHEDAPIFFDNLLPLMNVDFVRYGDLTVIPFPFKYLREWINTQG